jgi:pyrrolysine biosynthesis protein PylD
MTRLTGADIRVIDAQFLACYDRGLREATGLTLFGLACRAAGLKEAEARRLTDGAMAAVVPMDCGQGLIPGFAESVQAILTHLGCRARITGHGEVAGLAEAVEGGCDLVFTADDYRFVTLDLRRRRVVDNAAATAHGFVAALECIAEGPEEGAEGLRQEAEGPRQGVGGLAGREVLVIGCGEVGAAACRRLLELGARVCLYDIKADRARALVAAAREVGAAGQVSVEPELAGALRRHGLVFEASPAAGIMPAEALRPDSVVAAPGVPLGLTPEAATALGPRLIHDPLQTGVATMLMEALRP